MKISEIYSYKIAGVSLKSGDIICTTDGDDTLAAGQFWRLIGKIIPGDVDHIVIYTGPDGRCVEANGKGVKIFEISNNIWDSHKIKDLRGGLIDNFYGVVYPFHEMDVSEQEINKMRLEIANYCLKQAQLNKPYNLNFFDSDTEESFYCSQLAYQAYQQININLNTGLGVPNIFGTDKIIYPQEIWNGFYNEKCNL